MNRKTAFVIALAVGAGYFALSKVWPHLEAPKIEHLRSTLGVLAQIAATILGFLVAALAILLTLNTEKLFKNLQRTGHIQNLFTDFLWTSQTFGFLTLLSLSCTLLSDALISGVFYPTLITVVFSVLLFIELSRKFWLVLDAMNESINKNTPLD